MPDRPDNIMPHYLLLILFFLIWITSKIIFIFFESIVIETISKKERKFSGNILQRLLQSFKQDKSEIIATIFHATLNTCSFLVTLTIVTFYVDLKSFRFLCDNMMLFSFFDLTITSIILVLQNYLKKFENYYVYTCKTLFPEDKIDVEELKKYVANHKELFN